jgi:glycosyltransferase involved in cell wall biosynthesis
MEDASARVAVITRTKDRPILLRRALESVLGQTYRNFIWVVINDGGEPTGVDGIARQAEKAGIRVKVIHNRQSAGMEAASNAAIHSVDSRYIVIHDDDDTWQPEFLERTTAFLENNPAYAGVVTHAMRVDEIMTPESIIVKGKQPFDSRMKNVYLIDVLEVNRLLTISFLYKREAFDAVGDYDATLPVLGDWEFNVRFLQKFDIGVIPEPLANYHHRVQNTRQHDVYGNTVIAGADRHAQYDALIRNRLLRQDIEAGRFGIGVMMSMARRQQMLLDDLRPIRDLGQAMKRILKRIPGVHRLVRWIR